MDDNVQVIDTVTNNLPLPKFPYYRINQETGAYEEITRAEYKKVMRETFTVKHQRIPQCGHKFVPGHEPRHRNCEQCWFVFFQVHGELTQSVEEVFQKHGKPAIVALRGVKFLDMFLKFMSTVAQYKQAMEASKGTATEDDDGAEYTTYSEQEIKQNESLGTSGSSNIQGEKP